MRAPLLAACATLLVACGASPEKCPAPLAPTHLLESFCSNGAGFCFFDRDIPF